MWRGLMLAIVTILAAGCAQLPPSPQDVQAKKFESVPDKAVIYLLRDRPDFSSIPATVSLDHAATVTTYPGTYYRWEVVPGRHRIAGFAADNGVITLQTEAGKIYFIQQRLAPLRNTQSSYFYLVSDQHGRDVVTRGQLLP